MSSSDSISFDNRESSIDISIENLTEPISTSVNQSTPRRKRARTAKGTWEHSRKPLDSEPERGGPKKNLLHYCKYCTSPSYSTYVSTTFRNHLMKVHSIEADRATVHPIKKAHVSLLREAFVKAGQNDTTKLTANEHRILENVLDKVAVLEALVQLVTVQNLPYNCSQWPELHALLMAVNPTAENVINLLYGSVQRLVSNSYFIHKDILQKKLQASLSKIHLSVDVWSTPNYKAFLGTCVQFVKEGMKEI